MIIKISELICGVSIEIECSCDFSKGIPFDQSQLRLIFDASASMGLKKGAQGS